MNLVLEYLYRDAGNNKNWQAINFSNTLQQPVSDIEEQIRAYLIDGRYFVAEQLDLPTAYFDNHDPELDHNWHEYSELKTTDEPVTDSSKRDISDFLQQLILLSH